MTAALQQQVFALDARFNAFRAPESPNFRTLYIRRRSQLLRETVRSPELWKQYIKFRLTLLQQKFGPNPKLDSGSSSNLSVTMNKPSILNESLLAFSMVIPTKEAVASKAIVGGKSIAENYAFSGVHHIFDQHTKPVTMVKFANNDKSVLCCSSIDGNLSICDVISEPPMVVAILKGHTKAVTGFDWSINNDLIASVSFDSTIKIWKTTNFTCLRTIKEPIGAQIYCCMFQLSNNNLLLTGNNRGELRVANVSTGLFLKNVCKIGGGLLSITSDNDGKIVWVGNNKGEIAAVFCDLNGSLCLLKKFCLDTTSCITSMSYRTWANREARNPLLLVNLTNNSLCLFKVTDGEGNISFSKKYEISNEKQMVRSTFCPLMSFREGACVVTGSEDGNVYFIDVEKRGAKAIFNTLQGHAKPVLGISFNYDESLLATSDLEGLVIIWKRGGVKN